MSLDAMKQALEVLESVVAAHGYNSGTPINAITALRAAIEQAQDPETELETYKRLYELRGKALERPCSNCGHQPAKIKAMAQPEQEPVAWTTMPDAEDWVFISGTSNPNGKLDGRWNPLYTTPPRQWQGLTGEEVAELTLEHVGYPVRLTGAIEAKLKEKNT